VGADLARRKAEVYLPSVAWTADRTGLLFDGGSGAS
jgi:hypothetical protein